MASEIPQSIGKYKILSVLGEGSLGVVYKASDSELERIVAIKVLQSIGEEAISEHVLKRFLQESSFCRPLKSPKYRFNIRQRRN